MDWISLATLALLMVFLVCSIAYVLRELGEYAEAEQLLKTVLAVREDMDMASFILNKLHIIH